MSSSERLLIIGATGQLGTDLVRAAAAAGVDHVGAGHEDIDVTEADSVAAGMARYRPTIVINTAALHRVDACEDDPHQAYRVNTVGALLVARAAAQVAARTVHISTDYVFSGDKPPPPAADGRLTPETAWVEDDPVRPLNVYGASKAAGEQAVRLADRRHLIVRVSSLFGVVPPRNKGANFIETILKKARAGEALRVVSDQWITPTYTVDAAGAIVRLALSEVGGVAHVASCDGCTWHVLATEALRVVGLATPVEAVPASTYYSKAPRVRNGALHTGRLASLLGAPPPSWREALRAYLIAKGHVS
jgi:dTDP-4-dehydrorhamnose reductase